FGHMEGRLGGGRTAREVPRPCLRSGHVRSLSCAAKVRDGLGTQPSPGSVGTVSHPLSRSYSAVTRGVMTSQSAVAPGARLGAQWVERGEAAGAAPVVAHHSADIA